MSAQPWKTSKDSWLRIICVSSCGSAGPYELCTHIHICCRRLSRSIRALYIHPHMVQAAQQVYTSSAYTSTYGAGGLAGLHEFCIHVHIWCRWLNRSIWALHKHSHMVQVAQQVYTNSAYTSTYGAGGSAGLYELCIHIHIWCRWLSRSIRALHTRSHMVQVAQQVYTSAAYTSTYGAGGSAGLHELYIHVHIWCRWLSRSIRALHKHWHMVQV